MITDTDIRQLSELLMSGRFMDELRKYEDSFQPKYVDHDDESDRIITLSTQEDVDMFYRKMMVTGAGTSGTFREIDQTGI